MKNQAANLRPRESGSALILILVMVGLFGALSFALSRGSRDGLATAGGEQANLAATDVLAYGNAIKNAVNALLVSGCADTEISFENDRIGGYVNPNAPADKSCNVFNPKNGVKIADYPDLNFGSYNYYVTWNPTNTTKTRVMMFFSVTEDVCKKIDTSLSLPFPPAQDYFLPSQKWTGTYVISNTLPDDGGPSVNYVNKNSGCLKRVNNYTTGDYFFFQILY